MSQMQVNKKTKDLVTRCETFVPLCERAISQRTPRTTELHEEKHCEPLCNL